MSELQLNDVQNYKEFYGDAREQMPKLIAEGRTPFSVADLMKIKSEARTVSNAPKAVRNLLLYDYFDTRDAFVRPAHPNGIVKNGRAKIVLDAQQLIGLTPKSESSLSDGALILPEGIYEELEGLDLSRRDLRKYASEEWKKKDPIQRMEKYLIENNMASDEEMKEIDKRVQDVIEDAEKFAENSPYPDGKEAIEGLYATPIRKGVKEL